MLSTSPLDNAVHSPISMLMQRVGNFCWRIRRMTGPVLACIIFIRISDGFSQGKAPSVEAVSRIDLTESSSLSQFALFLLVAFFCCSFVPLLLHPLLISRLILGILRFESGRLRNLWL